MKWTHSDEQLTRSLAEYCSQHGCRKNYGVDDACEKGLGTPLFAKLRTVNECYECNRRWAEEWKQKQEESNAGS